MNEISQNVRRNRIKSFAICLIRTWNGNSSNIHILVSSGWKLLTLLGKGLNLYKKRRCILAFSVKQTWMNECSWKFCGNYSFDTGGAWVMDLGVWMWNALLFIVHYNDPSGEVRDRLRERRVESKPAGLWSLHDITGAWGTQANTDLRLDTII